MSNSKTFLLRGTKYNKEFAFMNDEKIYFRGKEFEISEGINELRVEKAFGDYNGKFIIFSTFKALQKLKENKTVEVVSNNKGLYVIETKDFRFINFNQVANISKVKQLREKYNVAGATDFELMENFIQFLLSFDITYQALATKWLTGIQREIFYKGLSKEDLNFKDKRFNLMRSSTQEKREFVYNYLKECCHSSGILETTEGEFEDVISIDASSLYPFIEIAFKFMVEDPYLDFYYGRAYSGKWDYFPDAFRRRIIEFYKKKEEGTKGKFYKLCINSLSGKSISAYEISKDNTNKNNFLAPQHGFQVIEIGRRILMDMVSKLEAIDCRILELDTDGIKCQGDIEKIRELLEEENKEVINRLLKSGLTFKEASCGIGQWKLEYRAEKFIQRSPKHYSYCVNGEWTHKGEREEIFEIGY